ncbi:MAG TPA: CpsD/CapB family tyrosine-protein kinase [Ktedonobacteraceae bacterium]|jgi:Mrp family chromosome partitioning ATPase|nr:CpsD/CapB family tyrosine-protein kinase [Ktedonobacteraceae bacterium]
MYKDNIFVNGETKKFQVSGLEKALTGETMKNNFEVKQPDWRGRIKRYTRFLARWGWFILLSMILTTAYTYSLPDGTAPSTPSGHNTPTSTTTSKARGTALFTSSFVTPDSYQATLQLEVQLPSTMGLIADNLSTTLYSKVFLNPDTLNLALPKLQTYPQFKDLQLYELQGMVSTTAVTGTRVLQLTATATSVDDAKLVVTTVYQAFVANFHAERLNLINGLLKALTNEYQTIQQDANTSKAEVDSLAASGQANTYLARSEANLNKDQQQLLATISSQMQALEQLKNNGSTEILVPYDIQPHITTIPGSESTRNLRLALSPIIGLLMGLGGALLASRFSRKLPLRGKKRDQILPHILAFIPVLPGVNNDRLRPQALRETASETLPLLRRLRYQAGEYEHRMRVITVTSPIGREGKSTVAASLAITAAQSGLRTILVDANPEHPVLHSWLQMPNSAGTLDAIRALSTGVVGPSPILATNIVKLGFVPIGTTAQQKTTGTAGEAIRIDGLEPFTELLSNQADLVIFDAPSLLSNTNTVNLVTLSDIVLLIVDAKRSNSTRVLEAEELLAKLGAAFATVLNRGDRENLE